MQSELKQDKQNSNRADHTWLDRWDATFIYLYLILL